MSKQERLEKPHSVLVTRSAALAESWTGCPSKHQVYRKA